MDGIIPASKSSAAIFRKCAFHLYAVKVLGLSSGDRFSASVGRQVHDWRAQILSGATDLENALNQISDSQVTDLLCSAIAKAIYEPYDRKLEEHYHNPLFHGYVDLTGKLSPSRLYVEDLKTGWYEKYDDETERDMYAVLVWDAESTPETKDLLFVRFYCRSGNHHEFLYTPEKIEEARERILALVEEIVEADPVPNPGEHCLNWYGQPCAFHGTECPLAQDVPALIDSAIPTEMQAVGQAFMKIYSGLPQVEITPEIASHALQGVHQIEAAARIVESGLKAWAEDNGPIAVGEATYGWHTVNDYEVDKEFALESMFQTMPIPDIAKVVNLSRTAIDKRISKRKYPALRESLLELAVGAGGAGKRKFGQIKN